MKPIVTLSAAETRAARPVIAAATRAQRIRRDIFGFIGTCFRDCVNVDLEEDVESAVNLGCVAHGVARRIELLHPLQVFIDKLLVAEPEVNAPVPVSSRNEVE